MEHKKITFDTFIRGCLSIAILVGIIMLLNRLSAVLLPFFLAWLISYLLFPLVKFFQYRCHLRFRIVGILCTFLVVGGVLTGLFFLMVPPMVEETVRVKDLLVAYVSNHSNVHNIPNLLQDFIHEHLTKEDLKALITQEGFIDSIKQGVPKIWAVISQSISIVNSLFSVTMVFLYTLFILLDYEKISTGWVELLPLRYRRFAVHLVDDIRQGMDLYFRGQACVALSVGVLFSIGFLIIDFPMAVGLGMFIGLLNDHAAGAHRLRRRSGYPGHHPRASHHGPRNRPELRHHPAVALHLGLAAGHHGHGDCPASHDTAHDVLSEIYRQTEKLNIQQ